MSYKGYENPSNLPCWQVCSSCFRCSNKGRYAKCQSCSGRHDPEVHRDPYFVDDKCRCAEGVLQYKLQNGKMLQKRFLSSPFEGKVITDAESQDEQDWNSYISDQRSRIGDERWDPVKFYDGTSTTDWMKRNRGQ